MVKLVLIGAILLITLLQVSGNVLENVFGLKREKRAPTCPYGQVPNINVCNDCSKTTLPSARIVGGVTANRNSYPSQVFIVQNYKALVRIPAYPGSSVYYLYTVTKRFFCGGTIVNAFTILTAAQCIGTSFKVTINNVDFYTVQVTPNSYYPTWESMFDVYLGVNDISFINTNSLPSSPGIKMSIKKVVKHPSFNTDNYQNDIALLHLSSAVNFNSAIQPACIANPSYTYNKGLPPYSQNNVVAVGWGTTSESSAYLSALLMNVRFNVYDSSTCSNTVSGVAKNWNIQLCAGDVKGGKDTCYGDGGSGLYYSDPNLSNRYVVVGITSYGEGCARVGKPGIYTRVSAFYSWITANWATA